MVKTVIRDNNCSTTMYRQPMTWQQQLNDTLTMLQGQFHDCLTTINDSYTTSQRQYMEDYMVIQHFQ